MSPGLSRCRQHAMNTPVVFFIFNRPDTTARVFDEIARARPRELFVVADGARPHVEGEAERCAAARGVVERVDWECRVFKNYADENMGCARRVSGGISWAFERAERAIILEDDCLPHPTFFRFCEELLEKYGDDERVMTVCGDNYLFGRKRTPDSYFFQHTPGGWGWATWRRAWRHYDLRMSAWPALRETSWLDDILGDARAVRYWRGVFDKTFAEGDEAGTWDYQWVFAVWARRGLAATAGVNLVSNIGWGHEDATHTKASESVLANIAAREMNFPLRHPANVAADAEADRVTFENIYLPEMSAATGGALARLRSKVLGFTTRTPRIE